jgi:hypothetical protein
MLQIGFGSTDITPPLGAEIPGGFTKLVNRGVKDRLYAVACVVYDGTTPVALVGTDTLMIGRSTVEDARRSIQKAAKIPGENVLIGASHTHTGGPIIGCFGSEGDPEYLDKVAKGIASAVGDAWNTLHASEVGIGVGQENSISFNRRFVMRDGREITHPGKPGTPHHEEIVLPAGPIDPEVGVLAVRQNKDRIAASWSISLATIRSSEAMSAQPTMWAISENTSRATMGKTRRLSSSLARAAISRKSTINPRHENSALSTPT